MFAALAADEADDEIEGGAFLGAAKAEAAAASTAGASQSVELAAEVGRLEQLREAEAIRHDLEAMATFAWADVAGHRSFARELWTTTKAGLLDRLAVLELKLAGC